MTTQTTTKTQITLEDVYRVCELSDRRDSFDAAGVGASAVDHYLHSIRFDLNATGALDADSELTDAYEALVAAFGAFDDELRRASREARKEFDKKLYELEDVRA